jgi:hypothetical protein
VSEPLVCYCLHVQDRLGPDRIAKWWVFSDGVNTIHGEAGWLGLHAMRKRWRELHGEPDFFRKHRGCYSREEAAEMLAELAEGAAIEAEPEPEPEPECGPIVPSPLFDPAVVDRYDREVAAYERRKEVPR